MAGLPPILMAEEAKNTRVDRTFLRNVRQVLLYFSDFATSQELASGSRSWLGHHVKERREHHSLTLRTEHPYSCSNAIC